MHSLGEKSSKEGKRSAMAGEGVVVVVRSVESEVRWLELKPRTSS